MKKIILINTLCLLGWYISQNIQCQDFSEEFQNLNQDFLSNYRINEGIYMQMDKPVYLAGEYIQFQIATYDKILGIPISFSKIVYIELYNQDNIPQVQEKLFLVNGQGNSSIAIPKNCISDYYYVRAYTNYMKRNGPEGFYTTRIEIVNPFFELKQEENQEITMESKLSLDLFPESGILINGIENQVVAKVITNPLQNTKVFAILRDENDSSSNDTLYFEEGYARFAFIPDETRNAYLELWDGIKYSKVNIPKGVSDGIQMNVSENKGKWDVKINFKNYSYYPLRLIANKNGIKYELKNNIPNSLSLITINNNELPSGVIGLQLVNSINQVISERYIYQPFDNLLTIELTEVDSQFTTRQDVEMGVKVKHDSKNVNHAKITITAYMILDSTAIFNPCHFLNILLEDDIKDKLEVYDGKIIDKLIHHYDLLDMALITISPDKEDKKEKNTPQDSSSFRPELFGDMISGIVYIAETKEPAVGVPVYQSFIDSIIWPGITTTNESGIFQFVVSEGINNSNLVIAIKDTMNGYSMVLKDEFSQDFINIKKEKYSSSHLNLDLLLQAKINVQISDAYNNLFPQNTQYKCKLNQDFYGKPTNVYEFNKYIKLPNLEEFIFEVAKGVRTVKRNGEIEFKMFDKATGYTIDGDPLVLFDGVPCFSPGYLLRLKPEDLRYMALVEHRYIYRGKIFGGIIDIYSRAGDHSAMDLPKNTILFDFIAAKPSSPLDNEKPDKDRLPLFLNQLCWQVGITTNEQGMASIRFKTGDNSGTYMIHFTAYTTNDISGSANYLITVNNK